MLQRFHVALIVGFVLLLLSSPLYAATFEVGKDDRLSITNPVNDDHYIAGGIVTVEEETTGDLFVAGSEVTLRGDIEEDLNVVGGTLRIESNIGDDARIGGGDVYIAGSIAEDLILAGGKLRIDRDASIGGDAVMMGGDQSIGGTVEGGLRAYGGTVYVDGTVEQDATINAKKVVIQGVIHGNAVISAEEIMFGANGRIEGDLRYYAETMDPSVDQFVLGTVSVDEALKHFDRDEVRHEARGFLLASLLGIFGFSLISAAFVILLIVLLTKSYMYDVGKAMNAAPWRMAFYGLLYVIATPIVALLLMISIIGLPVGLLLLAMYLFQIYFALPVSGVALAGWIGYRNKAKWSKTVLFFVSVGCYIGLKLLLLVPFIGWLILFVLVCAAFGSVLQTKWMKFQKVR